MFQLRSTEGVEGEKALEKAEGEEEVFSSWSLPQ
jgi:hypothetical protein